MCVGLYDTIRTIRHPLQTTSLSLSLTANEPLEDDDDPDTHHTFQFQEESSSEQFSTTCLLLHLDKNQQSKNIHTLQSIQQQQQQLLSSTPCPIRLPHTHPRLHRAGPYRKLYSVPTVMFTSHGRAYPRLFHWNPIPER